MTHGLSSMERKHQHDTCEHILKYCKVCDVVYCIRCNREWSNWVVSYTYPSYTYTTGNYTISNTESKHVHEG